MFSPSLRGMSIKVWSVYLTTGIQLTTRMDKRIGKEIINIKLDDLTYIQPQPRHIRLP